MARFARVENNLGQVLSGNQWDSIQKVATGKKPVTPALALRVAQFAGVPMDELLAGQWLSPRVCPHCGHPPDDFVDEDTIAG